MTDSMKYDFSYTGFSLRIAETCKVAKARLYNEEFNAVELIGGGKTSTTKKFLNEINKRLEALTKGELKLLVHSDLTNQKKIAFVAICKVHHFIRDFVIEVLRDKYLVYDYQLSEGEYISFFRRKSDLYPELDFLAEVTKNKIRQVSLLMLQEAGIIDNVKTRIIQPQFLDDELVQVIIKDDRNLLKLFLWSDMDIENTSTKYGKPNQ
jgi:hypothetical protein